MAFSFTDKFNRKYLAKKFDSVSGNLFIFGMISGRARQFAIPIVTPIFIMSSMIAYLIGYGLWLGASLLHTEYSPAPRSWLGFTTFRKQYQVAAIVGTAAAILWFFFPALILPAAWLFLLSNLVWSISEHHRKVNPSPDYVDEYSKFVYTKKQSIYCHYTTLTTIVSLMTAMGLTLALIFPPAAATILLVSGIIGGIGTVVSFGFLLKSGCFKAPKPPKASSPDLSTDSSEPSTEPSKASKENIEDRDPTPHYDSPIKAKEEISASQKEQILYQMS